MIRHGEPPIYLRFDALDALGVPHVTTTRHCPGVTSPSEPTAPFTDEARSVLAPAGLDFSRVAYARQVHGADAVRAPAGGGLAGAADILVTTAPGLPLAIFTADCLAIALCDLQAGALALAHVGWRGTVQGGAPAAVAAIEKLGAEPERITAAISPSIGPCCYEVDDPVVVAFRGAYPDLWDRWLKPARRRHWMLDLWKANEDLLQRAGIPVGQIENPRFCTACQPDLFFSYRKGHRGRLVTVAALPAP